MTPSPEPPARPALVAFGLRVRDRRRQLGLSQERAAEKMGIHWTQLGQVERGQRSSRIENILKIANGLGVTPGELMDGLPPP